MRCSAVRRQLNAYSAGELPPAQQARVGRHIARCQACRAALQRELAAARQLEAELSVLGRPSAAQLARIWRRVRAQTRQAPLRRSDLHPASVLLTLTLMMLCAAFVFRGSAAVAAPLPPQPAVVRATATPLFTETPDPLGGSVASPTASLTVVLARAPLAAPAPSTRKP
ncbi:MAG: zf-HC2 domain-containing protein [Aggregatilineales bacterium]